MIDVGILNKAIALTQKGYVLEAENLYLKLVEQEPDNYIVLSNFKYKPGTREICNTFDYKNFVVTYWLEGPGIIVYTFVSKPTEVKVESHSHFPVPLLPKRDESREISANLGAAAAMVFAYAVMKMPQQKLKKECFNGW